MVVGTLVVADLEIGVAGEGGGVGGSNKAGRQKLRCIGVCESVR